MTQDKQLTLPWWGVSCVILGGMLGGLVFYHFGKLALARPTLYCAADLIVIAVVMRWKLRRHVWFWITVAVIVALHIPLILLFLGQRSGFLRL